MALLTLGEMTSRILNETSRDSSLTTNVQNALVTAIKELEQEQFWFFETNTQLTLEANTNSVILPANFNSLGTLRLLIGTTYFSDASGFTMTTPHRMRQLQRILNQPGRPYCYALYGDSIMVHPYPNDTYTLDMDYYCKDVTYPVVYGDNSIWFDDQTQDLTRYKALAIFYRDTLQSEENANVYEAKAAQSLSFLRAKNNKREVITRLSI
jgi:hypothetical protein